MMPKIREIKVEEQVVKSDEYKNIQDLKKLNEQIATPNTTVMGDAKKAPKKTEEVKKP